MSKTVSEVTNEDCMLMMSRYPDKFFDLAVCDPDFGLNEKISNGGTWAAKWKKEDGFLGGKPTVDYFNELRRVSKNQIVWGGNYFADMLPATRCWIVWDKIAHMDTLADCELAWTSYDANTKIFKHVRNSSDVRIHICQKPVALYNWIFERYAKQGMKILDTHLGSQSSRIAAHKAGLDFWGTELDKDYFDEGNARFNKYLGLDGMFSEEHF